MELDLTHPAIADLKRAARRRLPRFAFEYLDSATGDEQTAARNRAGLDHVLFQPAVMAGEIRPNLTTQFLGQDFDLPLVMAPIGMAGSIWPGAEAMMARAAARNRVGFGLSNVAAATPEDTGPLAGGRGWFQHYPVKDDHVRRDMLARAKAAGFSTLVVTVDVPAESRRERQRRAHLAMPPKLSPRLLAEALRSPAWALAMARHGAPRMVFCEDYVDAKGARAFVHAGKLLRQYPDRRDIIHLRDIWDGPMIVKGICRPSDALWLVEEQGVDGIWVSNHGGRQFDGAPAAIDLLPPIRAALGRQVPIVFDSGIRSGLDVLRARALGADLVGLGRAPLYALGAFGDRGLDHLFHILREDMISNMAQIGVSDFADLADQLADQ